MGRNSESKAFQHIAIVSKNAVIVAVSGYGKDGKPARTCSD
jgi:hypothetical protein